MATLLTAFIAALRSIFRTLAALRLRNLVLRRTAKKRPKLTNVDRFYWTCPSILPDWLTKKGRQALAAVSST